jgi:hypothetical protein
MPVEVVSACDNVVTLEITGFGLDDEEVTIVPPQPGPLVCSSYFGLIFHSHLLQVLKINLNFGFLSRSDLEMIDMAM